MEYLSEREKDLLDRFLADDKMVEAVKKVLLNKLYQHGVLYPEQKVNGYINFALTTIGPDGKMLTDEEIGRLTRTKRTAVEIIEEGFKEIKTFKKVEVIEKSGKTVKR